MTRPTNYHGTPWGDSSSRQPLPDGNKPGRQTGSPRFSDYSGVWRTFRLLYRSSRRPHSPGDQSRQPLIGHYSQPVHGVVLEYIAKKLAVTNLSTRSRNVAYGLLGSRLKIDEATTAPRPPCPSPGRELVLLLLRHTAVHCTCTKSRPRRSVARYVPEIKEQTIHLDESNLCVCNLFFAFWCVRPNKLEFY